MNNALTIRLTGISIDVIISDNAANIDGDKTEFSTVNNKQEIPVIDKFLRDFYTEKGLDKIKGSTSLRSLESISRRNSKVELYLAIEFENKASLELAIPLIEKSEQDLALNIQNTWTMNKEYTAKQEVRVANQEPCDLEPLDYHEKTLAFLSDANFEFNIVQNDDVITIQPTEHLAPIIHDNNIVLEETIQLCNAIFYGYDIKSSKSIRISSPDLNGKYKDKQYLISNTCDKFKEFTKNTYAYVKLNISLKLSGGKYLIDTYSIFEEDDLFD